MWRSWTMTTTDFSTSSSSMEHPCLIQPRKARFPRRPAKKIGIASTTRRRTARSKTSPIKAGLQGAGYGMGVAVGDYDNDGLRGSLRYRLWRKPALSQQRQRNLHRCDRETAAQQAAVGPPPRHGSIWITTACSTSSCCDIVPVGFLRYLVRRRPERRCVLLPSGHLYHPSRFWRTTTTATDTSPSSQQKIGLSKPAKGLGHRDRRFDRDGHIDLTSPTIPA